MENIYNAIQNVYNMDKTSWQEVLAELYNLVYKVENKFDLFENKFSSLLGEEVTIELKKMYDDGSLAALIDKKLLKDIKTEFSEQLDTKVNEVDLEVERKRIDLFTSLTDGSTTGDAELIDGRIGVDGVLYTNIGGAIRSQIKESNNHIIATQNSLQDGIIDIKSLFEWEKGYINIQGTYVNSNNMLRTASPKFINFDTVSINMKGSDYNLHVLIYNADGSFISNTDYINKDNFELSIDKSKKYAFCLQYRKDESTNADLTTLKITYKVQLSKDIEKIREDLNELNYVERTDITQKRYECNPTVYTSNNGPGYIEVLKNENLTYDISINAGEFSYAYSKFPLGSSYSGLNDKTVTIIIKNTGDYDMDLSNPHTTKFWLCNKSDFNGINFNITDLMDSPILKANTSTEIVIDMRIDEIRDNFIDTTDNINILFGMTSKLLNKLSFNIQIYIKETEDKRKGIVVADTLNGFNINEFNIYKSYIDNLINNWNISADIKIVCYGDSLTMGAGWEDQSPDGVQRGYPEFIQEFSGIPTINTGVGGDKCNEIFARLGSEPIVINNITIPSDITPVKLGFPLTTILGREFKSDLKYNYSKPYKINPVMLNGVVGKLSQLEYQGSYYFTRAEVGEEVVINRPTILTTGQMMELRNPNDIYIFYVGQNGGYDDVDDWIQQLRNAIDYIGCDKYLIIVCQTNFHNTTWDSIYNKFKREFKGKFLDIRNYMLEYGLSDSFLTPTEQDLDDISKGICPQSLKKSGDKVHFNYHGYRIIGKLAYQRLKALYPNYVK